MLRTTPTISERQVVCAILAVAGDMAVSSTHDPRDSDDERELTITEALQTATPMAGVMAGLLDALGIDPPAWLLSAAG